MTREARTEPIPHPQADATTATSVAAAEDAPAQEMPPHSVRLADGRVAVLKENTAFEARMKRKALAKMGISPGIDQMDFTLGMAIMSIATLGDEPFKPPTTEVTFNALLMDGMSESDTYKLVTVYGALIGEGDPADQDFR